MGGERARFLHFEATACSSQSKAQGLGIGTRLLQSITRKCLHQDLLGANVVEDGGEGGLIEVEGGVAGEEEARFHPMEKVDLGYVYKRIC